MKTENLSKALDRLSTYICINEDHRYQALHDAAQQELGEVTKLIDVVKGFIESNDIESESSHWAYLDKFRELVGYKD